MVFWTHCGASRLYWHERWSKKCKWGGFPSLPSFKGRRRGKGTFLFIVILSIRISEGNREKWENGVFLIIHTQPHAELCETQQSHRSEHASGAHQIYKCAQMCWAGPWEMLCVRSSSRDERGSIRFVNARRVEWPFISNILPVRHEDKSDLRQYFCIFRLEQNKDLVYLLSGGWQNI